LELEFDVEDAWDGFLALPSTRAALDAVPDPLSGLIVYRGRGGSTGTWEPRKPRPMVGRGSAALPIPWEQWEDDDFRVLSGGSGRLPTATVAPRYPPHSAGRPPLSRCSRASMSRLKFTTPPEMNSRSASAVTNSPAHSSPW